MKPAGDREASSVSSVTTRHCWFLVVLCVDTYAVFVCVFVYDCGCR